METNKSILVLQGHKFSCQCRTIFRWHWIALWPDKCPGSIPQIGVSISTSFLPNNDIIFNTRHESKRTQHITWFRSFLGKGKSLSITASITWPEAKSLVDCYGHNQIFWFIAFNTFLLHVHPNEFIYLASGTVMLAVKDNWRFAVI